jgi:glycosyltransferase involved in cell wall biosynthesis
MSSPPLFSVIIPTYDRLELLKRTLQSVKEQSFSDYEIVVVDDGSKDGTREWLAENGSWLREIRQSNEGPGVARNAGVRTAIGEYCAFLDSDDIWFPWTLDIYRDAIERFGRPAFLVGKPQVFSEESDLVPVKLEPPRHEKFQDYLASSDEWRWWGVSSFVIRRDAFLDAGGFIEGHVNSEDADLALKLGEAAGFVQIAAPATFAYREHAANVKDDSGRNIAGTRHVLTSEKCGCYPGGKVRARERWEIVTRHVRPVALECLRRGNQADAWGFYYSTFAWHLSLGRLKYLLGFPFVALMEFGRDKLHSRWSVR